MESQGLLFSEPSIAETCVWCELSEGIDPAEWASVCRYIGSLSPEEFERIKSRIRSRQDFVKSKTNNPHNASGNFVEIPLISIGPSGIGGEYQQETIR
ncbi:MAG: hypothetical protein ACYTFW_04600 [Planctomycetota bacterium]|jgi:hypothetical protein